MDLSSLSHQPYRPRHIEGLGVASMIATCRSNRWLITGWVSLCMISTLVIMYSLTPRYVAHAELMLNTRVEHLGNLGVMSGPVMMQDPTPTIRSEQQVLESTSLAGDTIDTLKLGDTRDFRRRVGIFYQVKTFIARFLPSSAASWLLSQPAIDAEQKKSALIEEYLKRLKVLNDGRSFTMGISFWASDPNLAAQIVNTHARRYIEDQNTIKQQANQHAMLWLDQQLKRMDVALVSKEREVSDFRERSGLVSAKGATILAEQVAGTNDALSHARADLAQREAKVDEANGALAGGADVESDVLNSRLIQNLREREADLSRKLVVLTTRYQANPQPIAQVQAELADVKSQISKETGRIVANLGREVTVAKRRVSSLTDQLAALQVQLMRQDQAKERLGDMERDVDAQRSVYRDLLNRQQQIGAAAGGESSDAHLVAAALPPEKPYFPNKLLFLSLGAAFAFVSGVGIAFVKDRAKGGVERLGELEGVAPTLHLQSIPLVSKRERRGLSLPDYVEETPTGEFADAMRALRGDIMHYTRSDGPRVIAITSALPGEGKTMMALTMARSLASIGLNVLLIDCDLRRSRIAKLLGAYAESGTVAALRGKRPLEESTIKDPRSSVKIMMVEQHIDAAQDLLESASLKSMFNEARRRYDYVIIDTPPEGAVSDVHLISPYVDSTILVARWKTTPVSAINDAIAAFGRRGISLGGVFLNAVDQAELARASGMYSIYQARRAYTLGS